jgi:LCP family protein required for cell wall assembly
VQYRQPTVCDISRVRNRKRHWSARVTKVAVALVSLLVFGTTWYSWTQLRPLTTGMTTADVIDPAAQSPVDEQNVLMVGLDTRTDPQGNPLPAEVLAQLHAGSTDDGGDSTDTMIVIHIPAGGGQATAISIPRDSYVQLAGGFGQHKINSAFARGKLAAQQRLRGQGVADAMLETESDRAGAKTTIATVEQLTGLTINHYAAVNLAGFSMISQAVGGVPVCLKAAVHDSYSGAEFPAGPQLVSGPQALAFVRQRHGLPHGDLDRIQRQQAFLASMARVVLSGDTLTDSAKRNNLIAAIKKTTVLDRGWDIVSFARQLQGMGAGDIHFSTIPVAAISQPTPHDGDAVEVDPQQVQAFVQEQIGNMRYPDAVWPELSAPAAFTLGGPPAPQAPVADPPGSGTGGCVN